MTETNFRLLDDPELIEQAREMYKSRCRRLGAVAKQPAGGGEVYEENGEVFVELSNVTGTLAKYRYDPATKALIESA